MTDIEFIQLKINNVLGNFIGKPVNAEVLEEMKKVCNEIMMEHPDAFSTYKIEIDSVWNLLPFYKKIIYFITGKKLKSQVHIKINLRLFTKKELIKINNQI